MNRTPTAFLFPLCGFAMLLLPVFELYLLVLGGGEVRNPTFLDIFLFFLVPVPIIPTLILFVFSIRYGILYARNQTPRFGPNPLIFGIFFFPIVFAWVTLQKGNSNVLRRNAFLWLIAYPFVAYLFLKLLMRS